MVTSSFTVLEWMDGDIRMTLEVRNVGDANEDGQIQMIFSRYNHFKQRSLPLICIDIPKKHAKEFIDAINKEV